MKVLILSLSICLLKVIFSFLIFVCDSFNVHKFFTFCGEIC